MLIAWSEGQAAKDDVDTKEAAVVKPESVKVRIFLNKNTVSFPSCEVKQVNSPIPFGATHRPIWTLKLPVIDFNGKRPCRTVDQGFPLG
jgi:hypothetical protein